MAGKNGPGIHGNRTSALAALSDQKIAAVGERPESERGAHRRGPRRIAGTEHDDHDSTNSRQSERNDRVHRTRAQRTGQTQRDTEGISHTREDERMAPGRGHSTATAAKRRQPLQGAQRVRTDGCQEAPPRTGEDNRRLPCATACDDNIIQIPTEDGLRGQPPGPSPARQGQRPNSAPPQSHRP